MYKNLLFHCFFINIHSHEYRQLTVSWLSSKLGAHLHLIPFQILATDILTIDGAVHGLISIIMRAIQLTYPFRQN